jgi:hypothetical protein
MTKEMGTIIKYTMAEAGIPTFEVDQASGRTSFSHSLAMR